ncbi:MAG: hypothetical protein AAB474_01790 [Patescibacteria group bacterium]
MKGFLKAVIKIIPVNDYKNSFFVAHVFCIDKTKPRRKTKVFGRGGLTIIRLINSKATVNSKIVDILNCQITVLVQPAAVVTEQESVPALMVFTKITEIKISKIKKIKLINRIFIHSKKTN